MVTKSVGGSANQPPRSRYKRSFPSLSSRLEAPSNPRSREKKAELAAKIVSGDTEFVSSSSGARKQISFGFIRNRMIRNNCLRPAVFSRLYDIFAYGCLPLLFRYIVRIYVCMCVDFSVYSMYKNIQINICRWNTEEHIVRTSSKIDNVTKPESMMEKMLTHERQEKMSNHWEAYYYGFAISVAH